MTIVFASTIYAQSFRLGEYDILNNDVLRLNPDGSLLIYNPNNPNTILVRGTYSIRGDRITFAFREASGIYRHFAGQSMDHIIINNHTMASIDRSQQPSYIKPAVVVPIFIVQARDISNDEALVVKNMFIDALNTNNAVSAVESGILTNALSKINFGEDDWTKSAKTAQIGTVLNAKYLVRGTITQLGNSINFTIVIRDIKTLNTVSTVQRLYSSENIWDHSSGIPGTLAELANEIATGIGCGLVDTGPVLPTVDTGPKITKYKVYLTDGERTPAGVQRTSLVFTVEATSDSEAESKARAEWRQVYGGPRSYIISIDKIEKIN